MAKAALNTIKDWFRTGLIPTQIQFWNTWDSFWHKDEKIPTASINGLDDTLDAKAEKEQFIIHLTNDDAHEEQFSKKVSKITEFKDIDGLVVGGVYTVTSEDWARTLRYSGVSDLTILLSSAIGQGSTGKGFEILQAGAGTITVAADGFVIGHAWDETTTLYGQYALAAILVTKADTENFIYNALLYGKLLLSK